MREKRERKDGKVMFYCVGKPSKARLFLSLPLSFTGEINEEAGENILFLINLTYTYIHTYMFM